MMNKKFLDCVMQETQIYFGFSNNLFVKELLNSNGTKRYCICSIALDRKNLF